MLSYKHVYWPFDPSYMAIFEVLKSEEGWILKKLFLTKKNSDWEILLPLLVSEITDI